MKADGNDRDEEQKLKVGIIGNFTSGSYSFIFYSYGLKDRKDGGGVSLFTAGYRCFFMAGTSAPFSRMYSPISSSSPLLLFSFFLRSLAKISWKRFLMAFSVRPSSILTSLHHFFSPLFSMICASKVRSSWFVQGPFLI